MSKLSFILALALLACGVAFATQGQAPQGTTAPQHLVGEITAIDAATGRVTIRTDAGATVTVLTDERTAYRRVPPGETSLQRAEQTTRADLRAGDRVLVPGGASSGAETKAAATQIIVTARDALAERRAREREDWRRRGVGGRVVALDEAKREIVLETRTREGARAINVAASGEGVRFLRYAPDSFRRSDARPGAFENIRVGDQLRALGSRSADGSRLAAEEIISGSINRIIGSVSAVDAARGEVSVKDEATGRTILIVVGQNTTLRRIPHAVAEELSERGEQQRETAPATTNESAKPPAGAARRPNGRSVQQIFESLPALALAELKKSDTVVITATSGAGESRMTAVSLIAGETNMLRWLQRFQRVADELREMSPGLPGAVLGGNTGSNSDEP